MTFQPMSSSLQPSPSLQVFRPPSGYPTLSGPLLAASTLWDQGAAAIATLLFASKQTLACTSNKSRRPWLRLQPHSTGAALVVK